MIPITQTSWQQVLEEVRRSDRSLVRAWLYDLDLPKLAGGVMTIQARNEAQLRHLERCREALARGAQLAFGRLISLDIQLDVTPAAQQPDANVCRDSGLRPDFIMDNFVVSHENHMAHAAALRVLEDPDASYNPFFVHGPNGAGKTHLLQAICQAKMAGADPPLSPPVKGGHRPAPIVVYVSAAEFIGQLTGGFEEGLHHRFRRRFAEADLLVVDDIETFGGKSRSQEELFHVINALLTAGKQLVLAADRPPSSIPCLEPRLASRFNAGLVIAMDPPGVETRMRIMEQKDRCGCFEFPQEALRQLALRCAPHDLDRVLSRLDEVAQAHGGQVTMDLVDEVFREQSREAAIA